SRACLRVSRKNVMGWKDGSGVVIRLGQ
ncbi:hypothetical protein Tco_0510072, partial [Tanacetum coccineum]